MYVLRGAAKVFQQGTALIHAVDNVDLDIDEGEFVAIEGPSGSGKSSLLQLLGALDRATHGLVEFEGNDLGTLDDRALARLRLETFGFVFQQFNLIPTLSALENIEVALAPLGWSRKKMRTRADKVLTAVGLQGRLDHLPTQLSGGEQQRVAIARALSCQPRVLLADEPTGNLDSRTGAEIVALLRELAGNLGQTLIVITHDERIAALAPRVVRIRDGQIAADLSGDEIHQPVATSPFGAPARRPETPEPPAPVAPVVASAPGGKGANWVPTNTLSEDERAVILQAEGVRKVYRTGANEVVALPNLSFSVHEGEFVAVTGPSGSGKTTLLNCLSGLDRIDSGRALIDGQAIHEVPDKERSRLRATTLGFIFQTWNLVPVFSAVENVELPLLLGGVRTADARSQAIRTLERVGLGHRLEHRPNELSGGEQQRVAIARALAAGPRLVWADEPTGNLDSETAGSVMKLLRDLNRDGLTVVLVTHEEAIAETASRRLRMRDGVVISDHMRVGKAAAAEPERGEPDTERPPAAPKLNRKQRKAAARAAAQAEAAKAAKTSVPPLPAEGPREPEPIHDYETVTVSPAKPLPERPTPAPRPEPAKAELRPEPSRPAPRSEPAKAELRPEPPKPTPRPEPPKPTPRPEPPKPTPRPEAPFQPARQPKFIAPGPGDAAPRPEPEPALDPVASRPEPEPAPQALEPEPEPAPQETEPAVGADPLVSLPPIPPPPPPAGTSPRPAPDGWGEPEWVDLAESEIQ